MDIVKELSALIDGKKTYLIVIALMVLNILTAGEYVGMDELKETLIGALIMSGRSALKKIEKPLSALEIEVKEIEEE